MIGNVLYEKSYPQLTLDDFDAIDETASQVCDSVNTKNIEDHCKEMCRKSVTILVPEWIEGAGDFIAIAKRLSQQYEMDIVITEYHNRISVVLKTNGFGSYPDLKRLILLADELYFSTDSELFVLTLEYYTHATYFNGRKISPPKNGGQRN